MNCATHAVHYRPNRTDIEASVKHITHNLRPEDNCLLEIAWTGPGSDRNLNRAKLFPPTQIDEIVDQVAALNSIEGQNVYMSAGMRRGMQTGINARVAATSSVQMLSGWTLIRTVLQMKVRKN